MLGLTAIAMSLAGFPTILLIGFELRIKQYRIYKNKK